MHTQSSVAIKRRTGILFSKLIPATQVAQRVRAWLSILYLLLKVDAEIKMPSTCARFNVYDPLSACWLLHFKTISSTTTVQQDELIQKIPEISALATRYMFVCFFVTSHGQQNIQL
jgi:hypothetical protein